MDSLAEQHAQVMARLRLVEEHLRSQLKILAALETGISKLQDRLTRMSLAQHAPPTPPPPSGPASAPDASCGGFVGRC